MNKVIVIGGGAAGMMAAVSAARKGASVSLYEKNEKLGKKLYITGKGRCNLTNACDRDTLFKNIMTNSSFFNSAFYHFSNEAAIAFFEETGLKTKIERGGRVFPESDHSSDVIRALSNELKKNNVNICLSSAAAGIFFDEDRFSGIQLHDGRKAYADACILASGGLSYPSTGSTGDGYRFAESAGHSITDLSPSLTSIHVKESFVRELEGLSLKNVRLKLLFQASAHKKSIFEEQGEMLFTHYGISGPLVLSASRYAVPYVQKNKLMLSVDLKPALTEEVLDARVLREFDEFRNKQFKNSLNQLLPQKLIHVMIERCGIHPDKQINAVTKAERMKLVHLLKNFTMEFQSLGGYSEAVITKGGICVKEVNPSTMESKYKKGLYFAGEVLDIDALTGGYNLQAAWSTGYLAGISAAVLSK